MCNVDSLLSYWCQFWAQPWNWFYELECEWERLIFPEGDWQKPWSMFKLKPWTMVKLCRRRPWRRIHSSSSSSRDTKMPSLRHISAQITNRFGCCYCLVVTTNFLAHNSKDCRIFCVDVVLGGVIIFGPQSHALEVPVLRVQSIQVPFWK